MISFTKVISSSFRAFKNIPFLPILIDEQLKILTLFIRPSVFAKMIELNKWIQSLGEVKTKYHKYGGIEFTYFGKEICHMHGDGLVDVKLDRVSKEKFLKLGWVVPHHELPSSNMISYQIRKEEELAFIKEVILVAYDIIKSRSVEK